jgi:hypothetical protein
VEHVGTQFDPALVKAFLEVLRSGAVDLRQLYGRDEDMSCLDEALATEKVRG